jgi:hypothetical protein
MHAGGGRASWTLVGVDEISWRKHHEYLTLVIDHDRAKVVWGRRRP